MKTNTTTSNPTVKIVPNDRSNPPGKLADAELHFTDGVLAGLKLIGFAIWERRTGAGRNVTFPARQYSVNGERRSFALLRPTADVAAQERVRRKASTSRPSVEGTLRYNPSSTRRRSRTSMTMSTGAFPSNTTRRACQSKFFT